MKKIIIIVGALCLLLLAASCSTERIAVEDNSQSWKTYCAKYKVSINRPTREQADFYLDCYSGSVEEETDLGL